MDSILLNRLSIFINEVRSLSDQALNLHNNLNSDRLETAKIVTAKLKSVLSRFTSELYHYFNVCKDPDPDEISNFTTYQLQGEEVLAELEAKLKFFAELPTTSTKENEQSAYSKLPDLKLPEFSGDLLEWHQFWDQFTSNISRRKLNDVDKLLYLKSSLKGEAARLIDGFDTTNRSYAIAVNTLKVRYGKESDIIYAHHRALSKIKRAEKMEECRQTLDALERHLRVLQSVGEDTSSNHIRFLILEKFPTELIYDVKMRLGSEGTESVEEIRKQLSIIIAAKEEAQRITQDITTNETSKYTVETLHVKDASESVKEKYLKFNNQSNGAKTHTNRPKSNVKFTSNKWNGKQNHRPLKRKFEFKKEWNAKGEKRRRWSCIFCKDSHLNFECDKFKTNDERKSKLTNRCYNCFGLGHSVKNCKRKKYCKKCNLKLLHNQALCPNYEKKEVTNAMHVNFGSTVLQTAIATVQGHNNSLKKCRILLDCGSQRSYVTQSVAKALDLQAEEQNRLSIFTFGAQKPKEIVSPLVKLEINTRNNTCKTIFANVVPSISQGVSYPEKEVVGWNIKGKYLLADDGSLSDQVDILLGNDYYYSVMSTKKIQISEDLYLVETEFGWILSGRSSNVSVEQLSVLTYFQSSCDFRLNQPDPPLDDGKLVSLWDLESIGITDSPKVSRDEEAVKNFNETTEFKNNRYYVSWPWNNNTPDLPTNFGLAFGRLVSLVKRLDSDTLLSYDKTLKEHFEEGIIEEVPAGNDESHPIHYIPHHGVSAPGKSLRIVYDASAKTKDNRSLNECLYCGPMLLEDLTGLIIKFRCHTIGLTADVEKAFLQIGLNKPDRDVTRFLWVKDINEPVNEDNLVHFRFTRVPFGIISSPFMLNAAVKHHLLKAENNNVKKLAYEVYVDNIVTGASTTEEALDLYQKSKETFQQISMNLRAWSSNSQEFLHHVPDACPDKEVKILGLEWHLEDDTLNLRSKVTNHVNTKRGILKSVASIYDPCGYAVPTLLPAKLLLQDLWKMKIKWDTHLSEDIINRWNDIKRDLDEVKEISLPRKYMKNSQSNDCQIHCFTDAAERAYSAVVYIVGNNEKSFVIGKSRLVPIKDQENLKIPRLELLGVLIGSRLIKYVKKFISFNITQQILWTDSQIVIDWFNTDKLLTPFVSRRIQEIKSNKELIIKHIPSALNPADVATRPSSSKEDRERWLAGPDFLLQDPSSWPASSLNEHSLFVGEDLAKTNEVQETLPEPMEVEIIANDDCLEKQSTDQDAVMESEDSTLTEIKKIQAEYFKEEVNGKLTSLSRNLGLFKDIDGILRCKGRLKYAEWSFDMRYPIIIPKGCDFTNKVIKDIHEKNYHVGVNHTLSIIRKTYWIPQGKRQVQKVLRKCPRCVKHGGGPFKLPPTPALPHERVNYSKPFTFTGVDYLGPMLVKTERGTQKRWICLFTCLAIRAVHLEVVEDLSAEEGLLALRRMISTKGVPTLITSDNAVHFKLIADILANTYCVENKIKWRFIPALAPWFGGFYERLVGLIKHCLRRSLQKHLLKDSQLSTIIKEIEAVINTRPLTCVDTELEHILRPSDFLQIGRCITLETVQNEPLIEGSSIKTNLIQGWRRARIMLEEFKEMFRNRYLPSLRERYNHSLKQPRVTSRDIPKEGQIVQIKGDKNREGWKVGKIISLIRGSDGLTRVAIVKVGDSVYTRSIAHLYPLEVEDDEQPNPVLPVARKNLEIRKLPDEASRKSVIIPNVETEIIDDVEKETLTDNEKEKVEVRKITNDTMDVSNQETVKEINKLTNHNVDVPTEERDDEMESTDRIDDLRDDNNETDKNSMTNNVETLSEQNKETGHKRVAAIRALEKIREWTSNLMIILH